MKPSKRPQQQNAKRKRRNAKPKGHKNQPADSAAMADMLTATAGTVMVQVALRGATFAEKTIIAVLIPSLLDIMRTGSQAELRKLAETLLKAQSIVSKPKTEGTEVLLAEPITGENP